MANADFTPYIDLTIYDNDASDIYDESVQYAQTAFPEFQPRAGTIENALLEATAYQTSTLTSSINRLPDGLMEGLLNLMGFARKQSVPASATAQFEVTVNTGVTILQGTVVSFDVYDSVLGLTQYLFETDEDLIISSGFTTGTVSVSGVNAGQYPDIPLPSPLTLVSSTPYVFEVTLTGIASSGVDAETDSEYFSRAVKFLASLSTSITTSSQMTNFISVNFPTVARFKVYDLTDSTNLNFSASPTPGYVTVALCASNGDPLTNETKTIIEQELENRLVAGLNLNLVNMTNFAVTINAGVSVEPNYSTATVSLAVSEAIESYLSIAGWDFAESIDVKYLTTIASKVDGVKFVDSITLTLPSTPLASMSGVNIDLVKKGAIPIGSCTTVAV